MDSFLTLLLSVFVVVTRLSGVEDRLAEVVTKEGKNVDQFKGLVKENTAIQVEMQVCFVDV